MTPAQGRRERAALLKGIAKAQRVKERAELCELKRPLANARAHHKGTMGAARAACVTVRKNLRRSAKERRERLLAELRASVAAEKLAAHEKCEAGIASSHGLRTARDRARALLEQERRYRAELRRIEQHGREKEKTLRRRSTPAERRSESDQTVRNNVPPEYLALWERVKRQIKGSDRHSRTEAFLHYVEEHPGELLASMEDRTDALVRELEERYRRAV